MKQIVQNSVPWILFIFTGMLLVMRDLVTWQEFIINMRKVFFFRLLLQKEEKAGKCYLQKFPLRGIKLLSLQEEHSPRGSIPFPTIKVSESPDSDRVLPIYNTFFKMI